MKEQGTSLGFRARDVTQEGTQGIKKKKKGHMEVNNVWILLLNYKAQKRQWFIMILSTSRS